MNRVVHLRAAAPGRLEAETDLNSLDRLHGHDGLRQPAVELAVPLRVRSQSDRQAVHPDFDHAAERVALLANSVDKRGHLGIAVGVQGIDRT